jgi:LPXTG-site transpeptidase (sortase) family protein
MPAFPAKLMLFASTAVLVGVGVALASGTQTQRRSDLSGKQVRRAASSSVPTDAVSSSQRLAAQNGLSPRAFVGGRGVEDQPESLSKSEFPAERSSESAKPASDVAKPSSESVTAEPQSLPVRLSIPSLNVSAPVVPVGIKPDRSMEIPDASEAGWYELGPQPGQKMGSTVIAGHVDHKGQEGVFIGLRRLEVGAEVSVFDADGTQHRFVVSERYQVDKDELPARELFRVTGDPVLTLITCGGKFSSRKRSYSDNIVVRAVLVPLNFDYAYEIFTPRT